MLRAGIVSVGLVSAVVGLLVVPAGVLPVGIGGAPTVFALEEPVPSEVPASESYASEPATLVLLGAGLLALARRQRAKNRTRGALRP